MSLRHYSLIFFLAMRQMSFRIGLLLALLVVLSVILWFMPREGFKSLNTSSAAPIIEYAPIIYPARKVVQAGPSSPNQPADYSEERMTSPEIAHDPYGPNEESAAHPERLRHPERMFQPAPDNTTHSIAEASGIASASSSQAGHAPVSYTHLTLPTKRIV